MMSEKVDEKPPGKKCGRPRKTDPVLLEVASMCRQAAIDHQSFVKVVNQLIDVIKLFRAEQEKLAQQLRDMDNDLQDLIEAAKRPTAKSPPQRVLPIAPLSSPSSPVPVAPRPQQRSNQPNPFAGEIGLKTVGKPGQNVPQAKIPVPRVPEPTMKMQYLGDQAAFGEAMAFEDNPL